MRLYMVTRKTLLKQAALFSPTINSRALIHTSQCDWAAYVRGESSTQSYIHTPFFKGCEPRARGGREQYSASVHCNIQRERAVLKSDSIHMQT